MGIKGRISPSLFKGNTTYAASFNHPLLKKRVTRGLGTKIELAARRICEGLEFLCAHPECTRKEFGAHHPAAWQIFFKDIPAKLEPIDERMKKARDIFPELDEDDVMRAMPYTEYDGVQSDALLYVLPQIADVIKRLEHDHAPPKTFSAVRVLLHQIAKGFASLTKNIESIESDADIIAGFVPAIYEEVEKYPIDQRDKEFLRLMAERAALSPKSTAAPKIMRTKGKSQ